MKAFSSIAMLGLACVLLLGGCVSGTNPVPPLLVGVTPTYPPLIYKQGTEFVGVEADLARKLGQSLGRPVVFIELAFDDLIPALLDNSVDIVMSGLSVTDPRKVRISFSDPYLKNSLVAVMKRSDVEKYATKEAILLCEKNVGVLRNSSSDTFVTRFMPGANKVNFEKAADLKTYFAFNRIHLYIGDIYAAAWLISENESELSGVWTPLQEEMLAWGFRKDNTELREAANRILGGWKKDGTLKTVVAAHVPFLDRFQWEAP